MIWKTTYLVAFVIVLLSCFLAVPTDSFPFGAGGCAGGQAAVGGLHLDNSTKVVEAGTLDGRNIVVRLGNIELVPDEVHEFPAQQEFNLTIQGIQNTTYRGLLVRIQAPAVIDTTGTLVPGINTQNAPVCETPVVGITHYINDDKELSTGTLRFDEDVEGVIMDVTVVDVNNNVESIYLYSRFLLNFALDTTVAPTRTPIRTSTPTAKATIQKTKSPTTSNPKVKISQKKSSKKKSSKKKSSKKKCKSKKKSKNVLSGKGNIKLKGGLNTLGKHDWYYSLEEADTVDGNARIHYTYQYQPRISMKKISYTMTSSDDNNDTSVIHNDTRNVRTEAKINDDFDPYYDYNCESIDDENAIISSSKSSKSIKSKIINKL